MKIVSSFALPNDDSFESLLARQNNLRRQSAPHIPENRPTGELQISWKLDTSKNKKPKVDSTNTTKQRKTERRSASKNVFRKMGK